MIKNISWTQYWSVLLSVLAAYYIVLITIFYRTGLMRFARSFLKSKGKSVDVTRADGYFDAMEEVRAYFSQLKHELPVKEEIIFAMQRILAKYQTVQDPTERVFLERVIKAECQNKCAIQLSIEELGLVWLV